jgi:hypothetical protein
MLVAQSPSYEYQVGGSLPLDALVMSDVKPIWSCTRHCLAVSFATFSTRGRWEIFAWVQTMHRLQAVGICCGVIDLTAIGTQEVTPEQWYASVVASLVKSFQLQLNIRAWWRDRNHLSLVSRLMGLRHFIAPKEAEKLSDQGKEVDDLKTPETLVNARFMHIRAESLSLSGFEAIFASLFV